MARDNTSPTVARPPGLRHERALIREGFQAIAGIDEAGRGAWAGPVYAAAVVLPVTATCARTLRGVNDSKQLTPRQREEYREVITHTALAWAIASASHEEIDQLGIVQATRLAMARAVNGLTVNPDALVIDAVRLPELPQRQDVFYYADAISLSVAAASILAKTERDAFMCRLALELPGYGFESHKGYGTQAHQAALRRLGVSWAHRRSYAPVQLLCATPNK